MPIKKAEPNTPVLFTMRKRGKLVQVDMLDEIVKTATFTDSAAAEKFRELVKKDPTFVIKVFRPEPFPDGIVLENCHVHGFHEDIDGGAVAHITWMSERPYEEEEE